MKGLLFWGSACPKKHTGPQPSTQLVEDYKMHEYEEYVR